MAKKIFCSAMILFVAVLLSSCCKYNEQYEAERQVSDDIVAEWRAVGDTTYMAKVEAKVKAAAKAKAEAKGGKKDIIRRKVVYRTSVRLLTESGQQFCYGYSDIEQFLEPGDVIYHRDGKIISFEWKE